MTVGKVYLVGAGPGDPGLISCKGMDYLARADVVVYDHLIDERLLESAPPAAEKIYVGKMAADHTKEQLEINQLLVDKAKEGKTVVRLKGGDPFVLGRGGEEAETLVAHHVSFEVVPGVSSAIASPAYAGIPVTQRGLASSFAVIAGHEDPGKKNSSIAWDKLATAVDTLVFLMGMHNLPQIVSKLVEHGRAGTTPVAVIQDGTGPGQKTVTGNLKNIVDRVKQNGLGPPAVIVVGKVVGLRDKLRWFDNRPLFGKRILVTRARQQASQLSRLLAEHGAQPVELPVISIQPASSNKELDQAISHLHRFQWLVFTSVNGVDAFFDRLRSQHRDARALKDTKIGAIGPATARALEAKGVIADYVPEVYTSEGLLAGLKKMNIAGQRFLLPRADIADTELLKGLTRLGAVTYEIAAYRTVPATDTIKKIKGMVQTGEIDVITFTSSSTVTNLVTAFKGARSALKKPKIACIGPKTAETARKAGLKVDIMATEQTIPGLVAAIERYFGKEA